MTFRSFKFSAKWGGKRSFYDALGRAESAAIRALSDKIFYDVKYAALRVGLSVEDAEELVNDAIVITISNIQNQTFLFADISPAAYANGVARKLIANRIRVKRPPHEDIDKVTYPSSIDPEAYLNSKELESIIGKLLGRLEINCRQVLQLKYFENLRDKEVVEQGLTPYTSTASLKSKRSQCLNKLIEMAKESGITDIL